MKSPKNLLAKSIGAVVVLLLAATVQAAKQPTRPTPAELTELCENSDMIVKGEYAGGMVEAVQDCQFWVTFQIKPKKYFKKPASGETLKLIQFRKRYFENTKACASSSGPNAMAGDLKGKLAKPTHEKKIFFFKISEGQIKDFSDAFWKIDHWGLRPNEWHDALEAAKACHP